MVPVTVTPTYLLKYDRLSSGGNGSLSGRLRSEQGKNDMKVEIGQEKRSKLERLACFSLFCVRAPCSQSDRLETIFMVVTYDCNVGNW